MPQMKIVPVVFFAVLFWGCTQNSNNSQSTSFLPEIPALQSDKLTPEVLWSFGRVGEAQVSPDGKTVLYSVTWYNIEENRSYRDFYTIPVEGGTPVNITNSAINESSAVWRPDGEKIGYLSSKSGSMQLWEMNPDGTGVKQISFVEGGISGFGYSPNLSKIFYLQSVKLDDDIHDLFPDLPKANARLETDIMYRHWDSWHDYTYNHIFIADYSEKITSGNDILKGEKYDAPTKPFGGTEQIAWSPYSKILAYTSKKKTGKDYALSTNTDIYFYDTETGETVNFTAGMMGYDQNPVFSPDGKYIAWESMERDGYESDKIRLFVADLETGVKKDYSENFDQNSTVLKWSADSKSIIFISNIQATEEIHKLDLTDGSIVRVTNGIHNYQSVSPAGNYLVAMKVSMSQPAELYRVDPVSGKDEPITSVNKGILDQLTMGNVEKRWMKTTDGKEMLVWVIYPPDFDPNKKYPALLYNQGGPQSTVSQFWSYRWNFQINGSQRLYCCCTKPPWITRFRTGMERADFSKDYGGQNIKDCSRPSTKWRKNLLWMKPVLVRLAPVTAVSRYMYLAGHHEGRFKAFIAHDGIFNFEQMYTDYRRNVVCKLGSRRAILG
jgi:dipeptidyl aminopeptidase/acylaminoacyl peptidase